MNAYKLQSAAPKIFAPHAKTVAGDEFSQLLDKREITTDEPDWLSYPKPC